MRRLWIKGNLIGQLRLAGKGRPNSRLQLFASVRKCRLGPDDSMAMIRVEVRSLRLEIREVLQL